MKRALLGSAASCMVAVGASAGAHEPEKPAAAVPPPQIEFAPPSDLTLTIRRALMLDERIARGDQAAFAARAEVIASAESLADRMDATAWRDAANCRSALKLSLLGGGVSSLRTIMAIPQVCPTYTDAMSGSIALAEGRESDAQRLLQAASTEEADVLLRALIAMSLSQMYAKSNPGMAVSALEDVLLLVPATLLEEAALRRLAILALEQSQIDKGLDHLARYARRFPKSVYLPQFIQRVGSLLASMNGFGEPELAALVQDRLKTIAPEVAASFMLDLAKEALRRGKIALAEPVARTARSVSGEEQNIIRARLYTYASRVGTSAGMMLGELESLQRDKFAKDDIEILEAALQIARQLRLRAAPSRSDGVGTAPPSMGVGSDLKERVRSTIERARQTVKDKTP